MSYSFEFAPCMAARCGVMRNVCSVPGSFLAHASSSREGARGREDLDAVPRCG